MAHTYDINRPLIINTAFTGAVADQSVNPNVPTTTEQISQNAKLCVERGTSIGHFHVRDDHGGPSNDPQRYRELILALREQPETRNMVICASTSGRHGQSLEERSAVLQLPKDARPDMGSLTLSSMNFRDSASVNSPKIIRALAECMAKHDIKPELEVFDLGMVEFACELAAEGLVKPPYYFNIILGNQSGLKASFAHLGALISSLPPESLVSFGGIGSRQMQANLLAVAGADGIRIGLEDNLWMDKHKTKASNPALVERIADITRASGRELASIELTRSLLGLAPR